jgi:polyisoprenoid-binding protein YceI
MRLFPRVFTAALATIAWAGSPVVASPVPLKIDLDHSNVGFSVRHVFTHVQGKFNAFEGTITFDEADPAASTVNTTIRAASIDTNLKARDKDLRSPRFFDAERFPNVTFESKSVTRLSATTFNIAGTLTMHGVSKDVTLAAEFLGKDKDPWGNVRYGFRATTSVNRKDFGMQWNEVLESGGVLVGETVEITLDIDAIATE